MKKLFYDNSSLLYWSDEGKSIPVQVRRCFPWSTPNRFLSLRNEKDDEVFLIEDVSELDEVSRAHLEKYLNKMDFIISIVKVNSVIDEVELRRYDVTTEQGDRFFQTKLDDWPTITKDGSVVIQDLAGDLYIIKSPHKLDQKSREVIAPYIS